MLVLIDVLDSLSSLVVIGEVLLSDADWEIVESQSLFSPESVERSVRRIKNTGKSTASIQKEDYADHATAVFAAVI